MLSSLLPSNLLIFLLASLVLLLTPGPAVLYIVTSSVNQGRRAGLASVLGVELGNLGQVLAATLGLSAILLTSALAFSLVKYAGAAYLIYLGIRKLLTPITAEAGAIDASKNLRGNFLQGIVVAILNPKTALFFLAFLPQFVDAGRGSVSLQFLVLGLIFVAMGTTTDILYALLSGTAGRWLRRNVWFARFQRYVAGAIYVGLGAENRHYPLLVFGRQTQKRVRDMAAALGEPGAHVGAGLPGQRHQLVRMVDVDRLVGRPVHDEDRAPGVAGDGVLRAVRQQVNTVDQARHEQAVRRQKRG